MQQHQRLQRGRALGYVGRGPDEDTWVQAEVRSLEAGCAALGLTLVGVVRDVDRESPPAGEDHRPDVVAGSELRADDIDCVAVNRLGDDVDLRGFLAGVPVVVLGGHVPEADHA
jgi:hypothetical protein